MDVPNSTRIVIACYRPKPGCEAELHALMHRHVPILRERGLATDREPIMGLARDGTVVEVFEWESEEAIAAAHKDPVVLEMWARYDEVSTYVPLTDIAEAGALFSELTPLSPTS